jgi:hypothetical protein
MREVLAAFRKALDVDADDRPDTDAEVREIEMLTCTDLGRLGAVCGPEMTRAVAADVFELFRAAIRYRRRFAIVPIGEC